MIVPPLSPSFILSITFSRFPRISFRTFFSLFITEEERIARTGIFSNFNLDISKGLSNWIFPRLFDVSFFTFDLVFETRRREPGIEIPRNCRALSKIFGARTEGLKRAWSPVVAERYRRTRRDEKEAVTHKVEFPGCSRTCD